MKAIQLKYLFQITQNKNGKFSLKTILRFVNNVLHNMCLLLEAKRFQSVFELK